MTALRLIVWTGLLCICIEGFSQSAYKYSVNLGKVENDKLQVDLDIKGMKSGPAVFQFPKIIPGTYRISDFGKFVSNLQAFDKNDRQLPVTRMDDNRWQISDASEVRRITYSIDDIFDTDMKHNIYPMSATNIEESKNFSLNTPGVFGFFEGLSNIPFELHIYRPKTLFGSSGVMPVSSNEQRDIFKLKNADELYDSPIMYCAADTTTVRVGNCDVLISVYSPNQMISSRDIAHWLSDLLNATGKYLNGKLPTDRYAFLYYFKAAGLQHSFGTVSGALEHPRSSFYYLNEAPAANLKNLITDISSHEFFHIITPLTVASREVKQFNFAEPVMSRHLWLYEGSTEYTAHHVQVTGKLNTTKEFFAKLSNKITTSRSFYKDSLPFTELSKKVTDVYADQFGNVYQKGALISACLDLYLLHLSKGRYGLKDLTRDLGKKYGADRFFEDAELFDIITKMTYPEVRKFFTDYVESSTPIPYERFFALAGVDLIPRREYLGFSIGGIAPAFRKGVFTVGTQSQFNEMGRALGYKVNDEIYEINGKPIAAQNYFQVLSDLGSTVKPGDQFIVKIGRRNGDQMDTLYLSAPFQMSTLVELNKLQLNDHPTTEQSAVRKAWLKSDD